VRHIQDNYALSDEEALLLTEQLEATHVASPGPPATTAWRVAGIVCTVMGFVLLSLGFVFGFLDYSFTMRSLPVTGKIIGMEVSGSDESSRIFTPVIEYTISGQSLHLKLPSTPQPAYMVRDEIGLLIDPRRPLEPELNSFLERWFFILVTAGTGLFMSVVGFIVRKMTARVQ
jgi:hypothetical protein